MSRINKTIKLLEETKLVIMKGDDKLICSTCKKERHFEEFYRMEMKRTTPICKMCRQKSRLEKKYNRNI